MSGMVPIFDESPKKPMPTVLVIDDHPIVVTCVREALAGGTSVFSIFVASTANEGLALAPSQRPNVVILD